jgi:hypothetical protein
MGSKVPRQCPLVLLVEVRFREGKALGSEKGKGFGINFDINFERASLE